MNSIGLDKPVSDTRVVVAMSGGVDSAVTAAMLSDEGYDVVGITLQLYDHSATVKRVGSCCAGADIADARRVAEKIGFPHYVLDYESKFRESVMDDFADSYLRGETPIPCVRCNQTVKFRDLLKTAKNLGADALATGHYVRREMGSNGPELLRGADEGKDQSYFLFATTPEQLSYLRFPLGGLEKDATRDLARKYGLGVSEKPDSQDICFVPNGSYADVVEKLRPGALDPGEIVDLEGNVLGQHGGIIGYTVGQRKGLGIAAAEPLYVIRLEPDTHRVVAGPRDALLEKALRVSELNWLGTTPLGQEGLSVQVKLRSTQAMVSAKVFPTENNAAKVILDDPQAGIAPGQACVFYDGDRVLGGGWITRETVG
jgi:tRNA-specific 2-thiouridylase